MFILDTDLLSILYRGGAASEALRQRLKSVASEQIVTSIVSYEEQTRGWLSLLAKAKTTEGQVKAYKRLKEQLLSYCVIPVLDFDREAAQEFNRLRKLHRRMGAADLKIASMALVKQATVLTRNTRDFAQVAGLSVEDWS